MINNIEKVIEALMRDESDWTKEIKSLQTVRNNLIKLNEVIKLLNPRKNKSKNELL